MLQKCPPLPPMWTFTLKSLSNSWKMHKIIFVKFWTWNLNRWTVCLHWEKWMQEASVPNGFHQDNVVPPPVSDRNRNDGCAKTKQLLPVSVNCPLHPLCYPSWTWTWVCALKASLQPPLQKTPTSRLGCRLLLSDPSTCRMFRFHFDSQASESREIESESCHKENPSLTDTQRRDLISDNVTNTSKSVCRTWFCGGVAGSPVSQSWERRPCPRSGCSGRGWSPTAMSPPHCLNRRGSSAAGARSLLSGQPVKTEHTSKT